MRQFLRSQLPLLLLPLLVACATQAPRAGAGAKPLDTPRDHSAPTAEGFVPADDGLRLYYRTVGSGPDTVVIPLASWWHPHVRPLLPGRTLVLYDPRDRGRSSEVSDSTQLGIEREVRDLEAVRRHLGVSQIALIGWSYLGGMVALYATEYPERVSRVVMVGPAPPRRDPYWGEFTADLAARADTAARRKVAEMRRAGRDTTDPVAFCEASWQASIASQLSDRSALSGIMAARMCESPNEWPRNFSFRHVLRSMGNWDWRERAATATAPTLVVHGEQDNMPQAGSREWAAVLPDARLLIISGAGHYPQVERPDAFFRAVSQFLSGQWPQEAQSVVPSRGY